MQSGGSVKLSIIVPHYNNADLLVKLLSTIPDDRQIEVIVVDDHSTDKLEELSKCKREYGNRNIFFYDNEPWRKNAGAARNIGMKHAKGEYILFADSDDWFVDDFWSTVQKNMMCGADIIYFTPSSQKANGMRSKRHLHYAKLVNEYLSNPTRQYELKLRCLYWSPCSKLIKRNILLKNKIYFDEVQFSNDVLFSAQIGIVAKTIRASHDTIYCILERKGSLKKHKEEAALMMRRKVHCRFYFYLRSRLCKPDFRLLGFDSRDDWEQIKFMIYVLWYEWRHGIKWQDVWKEQWKIFEMAWKSFVYSDMKKESLKMRGLKPICKRVVNN